MWDKSSTTKPQAEPFFSRIQNWQSGPDSGLADLAQWGSVNNMQISLSLSSSTQPMVLLPS